MAHHPWDGPLVEVAGVKIPETMALAARTLAKVGPILTGLQAEAAALEREACARLADVAAETTSMPAVRAWAEELARAIRARGRS